MKKFTLWLVGWLLFSLVWYMGLYVIEQFTHRWSWSISTIACAGAVLAPICMGIHKLYLKACET